MSVCDHGSVEPLELTSIKSISITTKTTVLYVLQYGVLTVLFLLSVVHTDTDVKLY